MASSKAARKSAPATEVKKAATKTSKASAAPATKKASKPVPTKHQIETDDATMAIKKLKLTPTTTVLVSREKKDVASVPKSKPAAKAKKAEATLNAAPTQTLEIYVFGGNSGGELGLGPGQKSGEVARPKLNPHLSTAGVVQAAAGGMHGVALTHDNKVITWGVNDLGALGRDTTWDGGLVEMKDADASDSDSESDAGLNPRESTPTEIDMTEIPNGTVFTQIVAGDNATFALTDKGLVYGWGTFRGNDGVLGFSPTVNQQKRPTLVPSLKNVTKLAMGINHALALTSKGTVYIWGSGEQNQLGRKVMVRSKLQALLPWEFGNMKHIVDIGCGADHSFAISEKGDVYSWGLNSFGQTGIAANAGEDAAVTAAPTIIKSLKSHGKITCITGGNHNSIAATDRGQCLVWGRLDCFTSGLNLETLPENEGIVRDERNRPRILLEPTPIPGINAEFVAAGSDHCLAVTKDHKVFTWGFNTDRQTGQKGDDDIKVATLLEHPSVNGKQLVWAGAGGQYSMLGMISGENGVTTNGHA